MHRRVLACLSVFALSAFAACSGSTATTPPAASVAAPTVAATTQASAAAPSSAASAAAPSAASSAAGVACETSTDAGTVAATIKNFAFSPGTIQAKVGDVVAWTNNDTTTHTVTLDDGSCDGGHVAPGSTAMLKFGVAGTYTYHCAIHSTMKGTVIVS